MSEINDGGPAFPLSIEGPVSAAASFRGMTLRDYFAAKAMQGFVANNSHPIHYHAKEDAAAWAYTIADYMLAAREYTK